MATCAITGVSLKVNWLKERDFLLGFLVVFSLCSACLNGILLLQISHPSFWREMKLSRLHPQAIRSSDHVRGNSNAPIAVIEYADFQCPYCRQMHNSLQVAADEGKIRWVFRDDPLTAVHRFAFKEAEAAQCAGEQGKYWEYADALYASQAQITSSKALDPELASVAQGIHADPVALVQCLDSRRFEAVVKAEASEAEKLQIAATPTIFVNNKRHEGSLSHDDLEKLLAKYLQ